MRRLFRAGLAGAVFLIAALPARADPQAEPGTTAADAERAAKEFASKAEAAHRCMADIAKRNEELAKKLKTLLPGIQQLLKEKKASLQELNQGLYCDQCGRTQTEIEKAEKIPFTKHLQNVKGRAVPAPSAAISRKAAEYDKRIASEQAKVEKVREKHKEFVASFDKCKADRQQALTDELRAKQFAELRRRIEAQKAAEEAERKAAEARAQAQKQRQEAYLKELEKLLARSRGEFEARWLSNGLAPDQLLRERIALRRNLEAVRRTAYTGQDLLGERVDPREEAERDFAELSAAWRAAGASELVRRQVFSDGPEAIAAPTQAEVRGYANPLKGLLSKLKLPTVSPQMPTWDGAKEWWGKRRIVGMTRRGGAWVGDQYEELRRGANDYLAGAQQECAADRDNFLECTATDMATSLGLFGDQLRTGGNYQERFVGQVGRPIEENE